MTGLRGRMVAAVVITSVLTLVVATSLFIPQLDARLERDRALEVRDILRTARPELAELPESRPAHYDRLLSRLQARTGGRIVLIGSRGQVLADTERDDGSGARFAASIPDRAAAGSSVVHYGSNEDLVYARTAVGSGDKRVRIIIAKRLDDTRAAASVIRRTFPAGAIAGIAAAILVGWLLIVGVLRRMRRLAADARTLGEGTLDHRVEVAGRDEVATVATALESMRTQLLADERARLAFLSTASHELRTPLSSLRATLELMQEGVGGPDAQATRTATALRQTHRLEELARELLELSRIDAHVASQLTTVSVDEVIATVVADFRGRATAAGRELRVTADGGPSLRARADAQALTRIVTVLIDNALAYGRGTIHVTSGRREPATVRIAVADDGPGVAPADRERVFGRFERGDGVGSVPGTGLGLPIARGLAEAMGGTLELAASAPYNRFVLTLTLGA